jgi:hypothetical protein
MKVSARVVVFSLVFAHAGCAPTRPALYQLTATFDTLEYAPYTGPGTGTVSGQAFLKTRGGEVRLGAGCTVMLCPATSYSKEWFEVRVLRDMATTPPDERTTSFTRTTLADGDGRFSFSGLPPGRYYLASYVRWDVPGRNGLQPSGGWAYAKATVDSAQHVDVVVTQPDLTTITKLIPSASPTVDGDTPATFYVKMESGEILECRSVRVRAGSLEAVTPEGVTLYRNPSKVLEIVDKSGVLHTREVLELKTSLGFK